jgi:hypothetical protein
MKSQLLLLITIFLSSVQLIAQETQEAPKVRFEKVSEEEMSMKTYPNDTTAEAVILYDNGTSYLRYDVTLGFMLTHDRFVRIKILKQSGVDWGNFRLSLYSNESNRDNLYSVKGTTFNLESGKVVKSELKKDAIFRERENKYWEAVRLSMPSVKVGSVIDLKYTITTNLMWNLRTWKFQYAIPVKWSQYEVIYPEYFTYNHSSMGYHPLFYAKKNQKVENYNDNFSYLSQIFDYAAKDVPAMKEEPYLTSLDNFTTQMKFELANSNFIQIGGEFKNYTTSWNDIAKQLKDNDSFGVQLKTTGFLDDAVTAITKGITDEQKKLELIYNHVQHTMKWDGYKSAFTSKSIKKAYSDKTGNSADINLLLTAMLNRAKISAFPVVLSTRENGMLSFTHATVSDCNYVIVKADINGKPMLLDATEPNLQTGCIPFRCLNGEGHLVGNELSESVPLSNPKSIENAMVQLEIKDGKMTGTIEKRLVGLSAFDFRESVKTAGGKQEQFDKLKNSSSELDYLEYKYNNLDSLSQPVSIAYKIAMKEGQDTDAGIIYIDPVLVNRHKDNPFTSPTRIYPVDFGVPFTEGYNMQLTIPEGYKAEGLPESKSFVMEGKGAQFLYQISQVENKIVLNLRFSIDKTQYIPSEYQALKTFYDLVVNKQAEQIILKKTTL